MQIWKQVFWAVLTFILYRQISLQVRILSQIKNSWYFLYIIAEIRYNKEKINQQGQ